MKITNLKKSIKNIYTLYKRDKKYLAIMVWGAPGVGKSAAIKQVAEELGIGLIDLRLSLLNPIDLRGLPAINNKEHKAIWLEPEFLPNNTHAPEGILFLDEINLAPQSVMSAGYQLILDRKLGNYKLPDGWLIIAAGNRIDDNAAITRFPAPLANRFIHFEIDNPDIEEWRKWAIQNEIAEEIVSFLSKLPQHLYEKPKTGEKEWKSPRSWSFASDLFKIGEKIDSAVGKAVAGEFYGFLSVYENMPDIEKILTGKETKVPEKLDVLWALSMAISYRAEIPHLDNVFAYIAKFPKEFEVLTIISLIDKNDKIRTAIAASDKWSQWIKNNQELLRYEN